MSRHRNVRNRQYSYDEDDYYDDYYDEDEYDDYDGGGITAQAKKTSHHSNKSHNNNNNKNTPKKTAAGAVTKAATATTTTTPGKKAIGGGGIAIGRAGGGISVPTSPPAGWGRPGNVPTPPVAKPLSPPAGWSRPATTPTPATPTTAAASSKNRRSTNSVSPPSSGPIPSNTTTTPSTTRRSRSKSPTPPTTSSNNNREYPPPKPPTKAELQGGNSRLSMVVLGHVDAGKSTLMGQVLLQVGKVEQRIVNKYQRQATEMGKASFALAWVMDEDDSERQRGVTMDVATKTFCTSRHDVTVLDAPGHRDFIPEMIGGAASADVGLLVVAATTGEFESGFDLSEGRGQTREHILLSRGLGVSQLVVAINKLDASDPPWSQARFDDVSKQIAPFLTSCGFASKRIRFVPVSGLTGENVKERLSGKGSGDDNPLQWYKGPTLLEAVDGFMPAQRSVDKPLRFIINDVYPEGKSITLRGRLTQGLLRTSETVTALPIGDTATVSRIEHGDLLSSSPTLTNTSIARAGDNVEVSLSGIDIARVQPGFVVCHAYEPVRVPVGKEVRAKIFVVEKIHVPIIRGSQVTLYMHSVDVPAVVSKLISVMGGKKKGGGGSGSAAAASGGGGVDASGASVKPRPPRVLTGGTNAIVEITMAEKMCLEEFSVCRSLGRFVLRRGAETIGVGVVQEILS